MGPAPALSPPRGDIARTEKTAALPSDKAFTMDISLSSSKQLKTSFYVPKEVASTSLDTCPQVVSWLSPNT